MNKKKVREKNKSERIGSELLNYSNVYPPIYRIMYSQVNDRRRTRFTR